MAFEAVKENQSLVNTAIHHITAQDQTVLITTTPNRAKFSFHGNSAQKLVQEFIISTQFYGKATYVKVLDTSAEEEESQSLLVLVHASEAQSVLFVSFTFDRDADQWTDPNEVEVAYDRAKYHASPFKEQLIEQVTNACLK